MSDNRDNIECDNCGTEITPEEIALAYDKKDTYLKMTAEINEKKWNKEPVVIVDLDDVVVDFRVCFANWLEEMYGLKIDVEIGRAHV